MSTRKNKYVFILYGDMVRKLKFGINMSEEVYETPVKEMRYTSLDEAEKKVQERRNGSNKRR
jgi:hypothetical protein